MRPLRCRALAALLAAPVALLAGALRAAPPVVGDAPVFARIEALRPVAEAIAIDGTGADWGAIPSSADPAGDAGGDGSRDITDVAIAPLADSLLVRITTLAPPSTYDLSFWLYVDFMGQETVDLELGLYDGFDDIVWWYPEGGTPASSTWHDSQLAIGNVVEARIPYAQLAPLLPPAMAAALTGSGARPWLRVTAFTRDYTKPGVPIVDMAAPVASYRLVPTPYPLDSALPPGGDSPALSVPMPLDGLWYVVQGPFGIFSHAGYWGYDFSLVDIFMNPDSPHPGTTNDQFYGFGQPVHTPVAGTVQSTADGNVDVPPYVAGSTPANFVYLDVGNDTALLFTHLRQGTVAVDPTQSLGAGTLVGRVGNSGSSAAFRTCTSGRRRSASARRACRSRSPKSRSG